MTVAIPAAARDAIALVATGFKPFPPAGGTAGNGDGADRGDGPLDWPGYAEDRARARARSGEQESVVCGTGLVGGAAVVLIAFDFRYIGGSVGERTGTLICHALAEARRRRCPVVSLIATGGSRMQEGMRSLRQLARITVECARNRAAGVAHVAVLRHPTTGGVWASLGAGADVIIAVRGATVAFAGRRVRGVVEGPEGEAPGPTGSHRLLAVAGSSEDSDDFRAEGKYRDGHVDLLADPGELAGTVAGVVGLLAAAAGPGATGLAPAPVPRTLGRTDLPPDGWSAVRRARRPARPRAAAYLDDYFEVRVPLRGDRAGGVDPAMLCGIGRHAGRTVAYAAQTGTANTPAGFRTATRLIRLAERLGLPVLTLVDTPGAANDAAAERAGVGPAIAELFGTIRTATVPVTTLVIGEGGSGGALALASPDRLWISPDAYFSVIAPPAAAAILKRAGSEVPELAGRLRLRPQDLLQDGLVCGIAGTAVADADATGAGQHNTNEASVPGKEPR